MKYVKKSNVISGTMCVFALVLLFNGTMAQTIVNTWITTGDKSKLLQKQSGINFSPDTGTNPTTITIDETTMYQTMDGFGYTLTEGSAEVINALTATQQNILLDELFNPSTGRNFSVLRISIGASDLSSSVYTYNQVSGDVNMNSFGLAGPDQNYLIPILKKILAINSNIKILATPWTAPTWMKTNNGWTGGSLDASYYAAYAAYFVKYLDAMKLQGITIWGITPQNEPGNANNTPSMTMTDVQQTTFINNNLGPAIKNAGYSTKIIAYDHNCDDTNYPISVLNNSSYVDGAAFHLYAGNISAMTTVYNATGKDVYFTEQYTASGGSFSGDLAWHLSNVVIGAARNWSKTVLEWNLANDQNQGPHTIGGCTTCLGAITVNNSNSFTRNVAYYIISHISTFVSPGAIRVASNTYNGGIENVAFKNLDGSIVLVAINNSNSSNTFKIKWGSQSFTYTLDAGVVATFKWTNISTDTPEQKMVSTNFNIYPNLNNGEFILDISLPDNGSYNLEITNLLGQVIYHEAMNIGNTNYNYNKKFSLTEASKGIYIVKLNSNKGTEMTKKFIIY